MCGILVYARLRFRSWTERLFGGGDPGPRMFASLHHASTEGEGRQLLELTKTKDSSLE